MQDKSLGKLKYSSKEVRNVLLEHSFVVILRKLKMIFVFLTKAIYFKKEYTKIASINKERIKMQFYNVRKRKKVELEDGDLKKTTYSVRGGTRYALRGIDDDGTKVTRFVKKEVFDEMDVPEE